MYRTSTVYSSCSEPRLGSASSLVLIERWLEMTALGALSESLTLLKKFGLRALDLFPLLEHSAINCPLLLGKRQGSHRDSTLLSVPFNCHYISSYYSTFVLYTYLAIISPSISADDESSRRGTPGDGSMVGSVALRTALETAPRAEPASSSSTLDFTPSTQQSDATSSSSVENRCKFTCETCGHHILGAAHELALYCSSTFEARKRIASSETGSDRELFSIFKTLRQ